MWPFLLTWICSDLSCGLWQLMDDWWCCFSSVSGKARHLGESVSLTHSDLALTCVGQQKMVSYSLCLSLFPCLIIIQRVFIYLFIYCFTLCSLVWLYCKILLAAVQLNNYYIKTFCTRNARKTPSPCEVAAAESCWVKKCWSAVFTKYFHQWKINYLRVSKG